MQNETDFKLRALIYVGASALLHAGVVALFVSNGTPQKVEAKPVAALTEAAIVREEEAAAEEPAQAPEQPNVEIKAERDQGSSQSSNELVAASAATEPEAAAAPEIKDQVQDQKKLVVEKRAEKNSSREEVKSENEAKPKVVKAAKAPVLKLPEKISKSSTSAPVVHKVDVVKEKVDREEWVPTNEPTQSAKPLLGENLSPVIADGPIHPEEIDVDAEAAREAALYQVPDSSGSGTGSGSVESSESGTSTPVEQPEAE